MASSPLTSQCTTRDTGFDGLLGIPEPEVTTILPAGVENAEKSDFYRTQVVAIFKKKNYKAYMCSRITSSIFQPPFTDFDTCAGQDLIPASFIPLKWTDHIRPILNKSLKSASDSPVRVIDKIVLFVQGSDLHMRVHFGFVDNLAESLLVKTSIIDKFVKGIFLLERCIISVHSHPVASFSEHTPPTGSLAVI